MVLRQTYIYIVLLALTALMTTFTYFHVRSEWILFHKGERLFEAKNYEAGIPIMRQAIENGAGNRRSYFHLADAYTANNQYEQAASVLNEYLKIYPKDIEARLKLARVLSYNGDLEESTKEYQKVIEEEKDGSIEIPNDL